MGYCVTADVRAITDTDMLDSEIDVLIDFISELMDTILVTTNPIILRGVCQLWVSYRCMLKDPNSRSLGEYSENRAAALAAMKEELDSVLGVVPGGVIPGLISGVRVVATMEPL